MKIIPHQAGFIDAYISGKLNFGLRRVFGNEPQYGFLIYGQPPASDRSKMLAEPPSANLEYGGVYEGRNQPAVLAHDIELMKSPKKLIPSLVRFQQFYFPSFGCGESLYEFTPFVSTTTQENDFTARNGEISVIGTRYAVAVSAPTGHISTVLPEKIESKA